MLAQVAPGTPALATRRAMHEVHVASREDDRVLASGRLDPSPLYTHSFPLGRLREALDATRDRPDGFLKALVIA